MNDKLLRKYYFDRKVEEIGQTILAKKSKKVISANDSRNIYESFCKSFDIKNPVPQSEISKDNYMNKLHSHIQDVFVEVEPSHKDKEKFLITSQNNWDNLLKIIKFIAEQGLVTLENIKYEAYENLFAEEIKDPWLEQFFYSQITAEKIKEKNQLGLCIMISLYHNYYVSYSNSEGEIIGNVDTGKKSSLKLLANLINWRKLDYKKFLEIQRSVLKGSN